MELMAESVGMRVFTASLASLHLVIFFTSLVTNFVASDLASSGSKVKADKKSKLFWRLTVLQCRIAQFDNLCRLPLIARLFFWAHDDIFLLEALMRPGVFFTFYLAAIFSCTAVFLASDLFTLLRLIHVFYAH